MMDVSMDLLQWSKGFLIKRLLVVAVVLELRIVHKRN